MVNHDLGYPLISTLTMVVTVAMVACMRRISIAFPWLLASSLFASFSKRLWPSPPTGLEKKARREDVRSQGNPTENLPLCNSIGSKGVVLFWGAGGKLRCLSVWQTEDKDHKSSKWFSMTDSTCLTVYSEAHTRQHRHAGTHNTHSPSQSF